MAAATTDLEHVRVLTLFARQLEALLRQAYDERADAILRARAAGATLAAIAEVALTTRQHVHRLTKGER